ncbi:MAG: hypothetical protein EAZ53_13005 [Bacteroidetes bacterium]|nr:MAG: hypothetical protein EAZ53_13005 [Bacteroidota bacterium]
MYISIEEFLGFLAVIGTVITGIVLIVRKATSIESKVDMLVDNIGSINEKIAVLPVLTDRVDTVWGMQFSVQKSPIYLNDVGLKILKESHIAELMANYRAEILVKLKERNPENSYQAQQLLIEIITGYGKEGILKYELENAAFLTGRDVYTLLYVLSLEWRDAILIELGMRVADIDLHKPNNK